MPWTPTSLPVRTISSRSPSRLIDGAGAVAVGVAAEGVFALDFEQRADLVEDGGDFFFSHGGRIRKRKGSEVRCSVAKCADACTGQASGAARRQPAGERFTGGLTPRRS